MEQRIKDIITWLSREYTTIRTGQATPALLDSVKVESYGTKMSMQQVATVGTEDARTLRVSPWDAGTLKNIEKAIIDANLGVSVNVDQSGIRVIFPELSSERRQQLLKLAKNKLEEARVSLRKLRDEEIKSIEAQQKAGEISEDEKFAQKERIQKHVDKGNVDLEALYNQKEVEISK